MEVENFIEKTDKDYLRYQLTHHGISPRGIPGYGNGLVLVDADEHDEEGHITEDLDLRTKMVQKRMKKMDRIVEDVIPPELITLNGNEEKNEEYHTLIIAWGSNYWPIREAVEKLGREDVAFLHFKQVYPLAPQTKELLEKAKKTIIFENNAKGQFANLIKLQLGFEIKEKVLKFNGMPFSVEEVLEVLHKFEEG